MAALCSCSCIIRTSTASADTFKTCTQEEFQQKIKKLTDDQIETISKKLAVLTMLALNEGTSQQPTQFSCSEHGSHSKSFFFYDSNFPTLNAHIEKLKESVRKIFNSLGSFAEINLEFRGITHRIILDSQQPPNDLFLLIATEQDAATLGFVHGTISDFKASLAQGLVL